MRKSYISPEEKTTTQEYITYSLALCGIALYDTTRKILSNPRRCLDRIITRIINEIGGIEEEDFEEDSD